MTMNSDRSITPDKILNDLRNGEIDEREAVYLLKNLIENSSDKSIRIQCIETLESLNIKSEDTICDVIDLKILEELEDNSRISFNVLANRIGKTEATIRRRVNKLQENGIIKKFTILYEINSKPNTRATVKIEPNFTNIKRILKELKEIPEITDIWRLTGDCGLILKVEIPSIEHFNPLIENKISQIDGIKIVETCFITDIIK